ncbi:hypothetical protein TRFO_27701 [Tritrichomonas foetus]|uniref:Uncharacterized protein n=1 Tax=Tritrichomonas foetus TaxID=1144522 RepID=A0A1J4K4M1_9EUKA|nr:hypothetical protein TRFO_27701 [Tritrichomonas foetus]|eukprot:OHT04700.1 hypothetical protein TRFO_27701 [Tritrichomonas foetus]
MNLSYKGKDEVDKGVLTIKYHEEDNKDNYIKLFQFYEELINLDNDFDSNVLHSIGILDKINDLIVNENIIFSNDPYFLQFLDFLFKIYFSPNEKVSQRAYQALFLILKDSYNDNEIGYFYFSHEYHKLLFHAFHSPNLEIIPKMILDPIAYYCSTCIEARDSILESFTIHFFENLIQMRNTECIEYTLYVFMNFFKYPLDDSIISTIYLLLAKVTLLDDEKILIILLQCISSSFKQTNWYHYFIEYKLNRFTKQALRKGKYYRELSIEILDHLSQFISLKNNELDYILNLFMSNDTILTDHFVLCALKIFSNHMRRDNEREILLKMGLINVLLIITDDCSFKIKINAFSVIKKLIKYGNIEQRLLLIENYVTEFIFSLLYVNDDHFALKILKGIYIILNDCIKMNIVDEFFQQLQKSNSIPMIEELSLSENQKINELSKMILKICSQNIIFE